jgi:hypothetical protein
MVKNEFLLYATWIIPGTIAFFGAYAIKLLRDVYNGLNKVYKLSQQNFSLLDIITSKKFWGYTAAAAVGILATILLAPLLSPLMSLLPSPTILLVFALAFSAYKTKKLIDGKLNQPLSDLESDTNFPTIAGVGQEIKDQTHFIAFSKYTKQTQSHVDQQNTEFGKCNGIDYAEL